MIPSHWLCLHPCVVASLRVPGVDSDDETKTPSPSPHHGRSRPPSLIADSSSESDEGDARGEVGIEKEKNTPTHKQDFTFLGIILCIYFLYSQA